MERSVTWKAAKKNLDPRTWVRQDTVKGFADYVLNRNTDEEDQSFDNKEMLLLAEKQFIEAAKRNNTETMKTIGKGLNINVKNVDKRTALHFAVAGKNKEAVQLLLQRRVKVDQKDKHDVTPIHLAAWFGSLDILKLLVRAGAEQKIENEDGLNIMHCAAINNHTDIVRYIVDDLQMKELDKDDWSGNGPFSLAAKHGCVEMLEMLIDSSYNMATMKSNKRGDTPLHLAAKNGHQGAVQLLLQSFETRDEVNLMQHNGFPLFLNYPDPRVYSVPDHKQDGETALYQATDNRQEECVQILLEAGCDSNIVTTGNRTALHPVSERGDASLVQLLLEYGAQPDCPDQDLQNPLHLAVKNSNLPVIYSLIQAGCNCNATDKRSQTAMHIAAEMGKTDVVQMLLKAGLNLTLQDRQGKTALDVAARAGEIIVVDMIIKAERYNAWKETNAELNESVGSEFPLTFKLDHRDETKQLRSMAWRLAYKLLKPGEWKKLAQHWGFTQHQLTAIEKQWTGQNSYQEHGHRMLLIWLHGVELANESPIRELYQSLVLTSNQKVAEKIRMESENDRKGCTVS